MSKPPFSYDELPYPSFTFAQTSPDRLATLSTYYGMEPTDPENCRVLELGCGDGANLMSMAYVLPNSEFVGIDLSKVHIGDAIKASSDLSIVNAAFYNEDVTQFDPDKFGKFDYVIAHGLFSWVPEYVREKILEVYGECLAPNGVGYISYNAYPGCRIREMLWGMMKYHTAEMADPRAKVTDAVDLIRDMAAAVEPDSLYETLLDVEFEAMEERSVSNIYHDDLSSCNQPLYFHQFVDHLRKHGFQYLSESEPTSMNLGKLSKAGRDLVNKFGDDLIRREQYLDFVQCRRFRSTLFCRETQSLDREPPPSIVRRFFIGSDVKPQPNDDALTTVTPQKFVGSHDASLEINHPLTKAALTYMGSTWVRRSSFDELIAASANLLGRKPDEIPAEDVDRTSAYLVQLFNAGFVKFYRSRPPFAGSAGEYPRSSAFARWQIARGSESVTTMTGLNLKPEADVIRLLISLTDGTRTRADLTAEILENMEGTEREKEKLNLQLPEMIEYNLDKMAAAGLLIE